MPPSRRSIWQSPLVPAAIVLAGCGGVVAVHTGWIQFTWKPGLEFMAIVIATNLLVFAWIIFASRWAPDRRVVAMLAFGAAQAGVHQMVRLDGFAGDGIPIWRWKWSAPATVDWNARRVAVIENVELATTTDVDFPSFRGRDRSGAVNTSLAREWTTQPPRLLWRQPIGAGWSSFAIVGEYCVTQEQRGEYEATVCYELCSGRERWAHREKAYFSEPTSGPGPRATPTIHAGRVYSLGATGILNCLDGADGRPIWTVNILEDNRAANRLFGVTNSPLVVGDKVIVNPGVVGGSLAAYDLESGKRIWRAGDAGASYSSPHFAVIRGEEQILDFNADGLLACDLATGDVRWSVPWISNPEERNNVGQPVVRAGDNADEVFLASGYGMGCALFEIRREGDAWIVAERWRNLNLKAKFSSVVSRDGYIYGLDDARLTCVEWATGRRCWKGGRYGYGQLLLVDDLLVIQAESGAVALVQASPKAFRELGRTDALAVRTWNQPALAGRYLLVRNDREAACLELPR